MASGVTGGGGAERSTTGWPISRKNGSMPAGENVENNFAGAGPFLKECTVSRGI